MPIAVELRSPQGAVIETLGDFRNVLHETLPYYDDKTFRLLSTIDWYGDTEFSAAQMADLLQELDRIMSTAGHLEQVDFLRRLKGIAARCASTPGCRLAFIGD